MLKKLFGSPVGRKLITGITGLGLVAFVVLHMVGNLAFFQSDQAYNEYSHFLTGLGPLFYAVEFGLLAMFAFHIYLGVSIWLGKRKARPTGYDQSRSAGGPSRQTLASRSMILTGLILMAFLFFHLYSFKFGPGGPGNGDAAFLVGYDGAEPIRDLAKLVRLKFSQPLYAFGYSGTMLLLIVHLRHGVWSAFQSLGALKPSVSPLVYAIGGLLGAGIGAGFVLVPLGLYFNLI
jgi:succinate dehydrogenase cytochrome b subunit